MDGELPPWIRARRAQIRRDAEALCASLRGRPVGSTQDDDEPVNFSEDDE